VVAFVKANGKHLIVEGSCPGFITTAPRGLNGFGYDPVFQPEGSIHTFAELSLDAKNAISHRAIALRKAHQVLQFLLAAEQKHLVAITGNIGCGKTTVAHYLSSQDEYVIDADAIGHAVLRQPDVHLRIVEAFGDAVLDTSREGIDRNLLRQLVCGDKRRLRTLNSITHPAIHTALADIIHAAPRHVVFVEAALVFESGWDFFFDEVLAVTCRPSLQRRRVLAHTRMRGSELDALLSAQLSQKEKAARADHAILNNDSLERLHHQVQQALKSIHKAAGNDTQHRE